VVTAPTPPEPLPRPALDAHTHLDMIELPVSEVIAAARAAGITRVVTVGTDLGSSRWSSRCAEEHDGVYAAVAIHPNETQAISAEVGAGAPVPGSPAAGEVLAEIEALARQPRVVAVGETGLDYYRDHAAPDVQRWWFREHIKIAKRTGQALMIHDREAHADVLRILAEEGPPERVVFHCFSGDVTMVKQCAEAGYVMSFAGNVTFANAQPLRDAAAAAPPDLLLAETDAPFLTPVPNRGRPNQPAQVAYTLRRLAEIQGLGLAELCDTVTATAQRTFGPW
jgi:TatD DNase family protein